MKPEVTSVESGHHADSLMIAAGVLLLALMWSALLLPERSLLVYHDAFEQTYSWWEFNTKQIQRLDPPFWDPYTSGGRSHVGEGQEFTLYPLFWIYALTVGYLIPTSPSIHLFGFIHAVWAFIGAYFLARAARISPVAALAAGLVFSMGGFFSERAWQQLNIFNATAWVPWALCFAILYLRRPRIAWLLASGGALGMSILAGHVQPAFHAGFAIAVLVAVDGISKRKARPRGTSWKVAIGGIVIPPLAASAVAAPQLIASYQYLRNAFRWVGRVDPLLATVDIPFSIIAENPSLHLSQINTALFQGLHGMVDGSLYFGIAVLIAAVWGIGSRGLLKVAGVILVTTGLLLSVGDTTPFLRIFVFIVPIADKIREPVRYLLLTHIGVTLLVAAGVQQLLHAARPKRSAMAAIASVAGAAILAFAGSMQPPGWALAIAGGAAAAIIAATWFVRTSAHSVAAGVVVVALMSVEMATMWQRSIPRSSADLPDAQTRFSNDDTLRLKQFMDEHPGQYRLDFVDTGFPRNIGRVLRVFTVSGYGATLPIGFFRLRMETGWLPPEPGADLLGIRYVVSGRELEHLPMVGRINSLRVYENARALPPAWIAEETRIADDESALRQIRERTIDPRLTTLISSRSAHLLRPRAGSGNAVVQVMNPSHLQVRTNGDGDSLLVTTQPYFPGWTASVDGRRIPILRVNYGFIGVMVPGGNHRVSLHYLPWSIYFGIAVSCLCIPVIVASCVRAFREP